MHRAPSLTLLDGHSQKGIARPRGTTAVISMNRFPDFWEVRTLPRSRRWKMVLSHIFSAVVTWDGHSTDRSMDSNEALISLLLMAGLILLVGSLRQLADWALPRTPHWHSAAQELSATFQVCACTHELGLLADRLPQPQVALWLTYIFTVLHGWTLAGTVANPASSLQQLYKRQLGARPWGLQTLAQFAAAFLAHLCMRLIWALGLTSGHARALPDLCGHPIQTGLASAFGLELLFSFLFHLTLLQFEAMNSALKVHLVALLITSFVYAGGNLTGAVFNPALAFSLHGSCFVDQFWSYMVVYCIAPCVGSVLVSVVWDEVLPGLYRDF